MNQTPKETIDLSKNSPKEELTKMAQICQKLNYMFEKDKIEKEELPALKKDEKKFELKK